jgi:hypothetical protein
MPSGINLKLLINSVIYVKKKTLINKKSQNPDIIDETVYGFKETYQNFGFDR